jgi:hypothetical protein
MKKIKNKVIRYANGEIVTKYCMEDEDWYGEYSSLMEWHNMGDNVEDLYQKYLKDYKSIFKKECPNKDQILRWSVVLVERMANWLYCLKKDKENQCLTIIKYRKMFDKDKSFVNLDKIKNIVDPPDHPKSK